MSSHTMKIKLLLLIVPCIVIISIFLVLEAKEFHDALISYVMICK